MSLTCNKDWVDDLVQDTILRAWDKRDTFEAGTNLQAWVFTICAMGSTRIIASAPGGRGYDREPYAASQVTLPDQMGRLDLQDFSSALTKLPPDQRDALILVGAEGMTSTMWLYPWRGSWTARSRSKAPAPCLADFLGLDEDDALGHAYRRPT